MDGAAGSGENGDNFSGMNLNSADLVYQFMERNPKNEEGVEMELSLGLSMNGRFGVDRTRETLRRSTSLSNVIVADNSAGNASNSEARAVAFGSYAPLVRASSLPSKVETQERRRQEVIQSPRSVEKLKNPMVVTEKGNCSGDFVAKGLHVDGNRIPQRQEATHNPRTSGSSVERDEEHSKKCMTEMPYVSTRGFGPDNRQINGFLYRYKRGEDIKILCVCHGMFLSPAEFVKHGGGGDVKNPLKHIVVTSFPLYN